VLAAAKVGGIAANDREPVEFASDNLRIQTNVLDAALSVGVERLLFLGSSCVYPKLAPQPIPESALLTGPLEPTNEAYAIAKIAGLVQVRSVRRQYGLPWISVMPTNLYGPGDDFSREGSHVLPALIGRYVDAARAGDEVVVNWGSGNPRREFLHADDLAAACVVLLDHYDGDEHVNVGAGSDVTIRELADLVAEAADYRGRTEWDTSRPDGTPRKLLDSSRMRALGWEPRITLEEGIRSTLAAYDEARRESA
jgi:GDP-L-fucose synthase